MANVAQMAVNEFWTSINALRTTANTENAALEAQRRKLIASSASARSDPDKARSAQRQAVLAPLIHRNSQLRMQYRDLVGKFNSAVKSASDFLTKHNFTVPDQLGQIETGVVIVGVAVAVLGTAWAVAYSIQSSRRNLDKAIDNALRVANDPSATPEQRRAAQDLLKIADKTLPKGPLGLDLGSLTVPLIVVAVILVGPQLLSTFGRRRAA
jgi:hypothetical protein